MSKMSISQVLFKAAQIIERDGHTKGTLEDSQGRVCLFGAVSKAESGDAYSGGWEKFKTACNILGMTPNDAVDWNNAPERTAEEVIDMLVIASIEAEEV